MKVCGCTIGPPPFPQACHACGASGAPPGYLPVVPFQSLTSEIDAIQRHLDERDARIEQLERELEALREHARKES